jgi:predicted glycogen debranching enzyme
MLDFGRDICNKLDMSGAREWLVTNGIGGYASGTIAGVLTRRYHGLLVAALNPPLERTLLLAKLEEAAVYESEEYNLSANRWGSGAVEPQGFHLMERFHLEGTTPVWTYAIADALLEKRVWMEQGENTTYIRYDLVRCTDPLNLTLKALVNYRDHHGGTQNGDHQFQVEPHKRGLCITAYEQFSPFYLLCDRAKITQQYQWYKDYFLSVEAYRGLSPADDHLHVGNFHITLSTGESLTMIASTEENSDMDGEASYTRQRKYDQDLIDQSHFGDAEPEIQHLVLAADQFIVQRSTVDNPEGRTILAGYPWFGDWGRDTMISLTGLTLTTGRFDVARSILQTYSKFVDQGMIPNRFPEIGAAPEYNTVDATLWYFEAIRAYFDVTRDVDLLQELFPVLKEIISWHTRGTRYNIRVDAVDSLLHAGEPGVQLTWMDATVGGWVVTPRIGKPVEINALWYNALRIMSEFSNVLSESGEVYEQLADEAEGSFSRFWNEEAGHCYDVLDGQDGDDLTLRPNQLIAVSLPHSPLNKEQQRSIVDICAAYLLTPHGMRSLAPDHEDYSRRYGGDQIQRDAAYHQGTVWAWLIGPFVLAHLRAYRDPVIARSYLNPLIRHLSDHGVGSISEIFDGDPPFTARGCFAQAWSIAEVLRAWQLTERTE